MVEVAYSVDPLYRRPGYGKDLLDASAAWGHQDPRAAIVRATVAPGNVASLANLRAFPFQHVDE